MPTDRILADWRGRSALRLGCANTLTAVQELILSTPAKALEKTQSHQPKERDRETDRNRKATHLNRVQAKLPKDRERHPSPLGGFNDKTTIFKHRADENYVLAGYTKRWWLFHPAQATKSYQESEQNP